MLSHREQLQELLRLPEEEQKARLEKIINSRGRQPKAPSSSRPQPETRLTETTFSTLRAEAGSGLKNLLDGVVDTGKGIFETGKGLVQGIDALALGLGALAIMTVGGVISPIPAAISKSRNIVDVNQQIFRFAETNAFVARLCGYGLLGFAGGWWYLQTRK